MALVLDTGPILALLDASDPDHQACVAMVDQVAEDLVVPTPVLVEVDYWTMKLLGGETWAVFVDDIVRGAYRLEQVVEADLQRAAELEREYAGLDLGLVDASVISVCERLDEPKVATLDRRDFSLVRPRHVDALHLLPTTLGEK